MKTLSKKKHLVISAISAAALLAAQPFANAFELNTISSVPISVHGFATLTGGWNDSNQNYMSVDGDRASIKGKEFGMKNSLVGLQVGAQLSQNLNFTTQIVGIYNKDFDAQASWAYLKYDITPNVSFSAGRVRQPMFLYSDTYQVGTTYPWVNPPVEIYSLIPWYNINGATLNLSKSLTGSWGINSKTYYGFAKSKVNFPMGIGDLSALNIMGETLSVSNDRLTLQASYMHAYFSIHSLPQLTGAPTPVVPKTSAYFLGLAAKLNYKNFLAISEIGKRQVGGHAPTGTDHQGGEMPAYLGGYATVGYKYRNFLPSITFSAIRTTNKSKVLIPTPSSGAFPQNPIITTQNAITAALKYNINQNMDVKASMQRIYTCGGWGMFDGFREGTNGAFSGGNSPVGKPVNVYQLAFNLVF